jgi:hypothetical protein
VLFLVAAGVGGEQPVHAGAEVAVAGRPDSEVEVVGHQAKGQEAHREGGHSLGEQANEAVVVSLSVEDLGAAVTTVEGVVAKASWRRARGGSHTVIMVRHDGVGKGN